MRMTESGNQAKRPPIVSHFLRVPLLLHANVVFRSVAAKVTLLACFAQVLHEEPHPRPRVSGPLEPIAPLGHPLHFQIRSPAQVVTSDPKPALLSITTAETLPSATRSKGRLVPRQRRTIFRVAQLVVRTLPPHGNSFIEPAYLDDPSTGEGVAARQSVHLNVPFYELMDAISTISSPASLSASDLCVK